ncbi:hypothetical protein [Dyadobacter sp. CY312]|uniref:hypothetical protein n=1 Tax=Dyadobacter sp. CY312 TaxID=2907303 RepID=UPI001F3D29A3|nr:hypothetical protein [Dyadobacter sp. CY312]MCE7042244.1 hypothetical protein [Dyadobacter sp. CY312]
MKHIYLILLVFFGVLASVYAQNHKTKAGSVRKQSSHIRSKEISRFAITAKGGLTQFYGELNEQDMVGSYGLGVSGRLTKGISVSLDYSAGKIGGQKITFFNSYFITEYNAAEMIAKWNLTKQFSRKKEDLFDVSVYTGVGVIFFNSNAYDVDTDGLQRFSNSETSKRNQLFLRWGNPRGRAGIKKTHERIIPIGSALDYNLTERLKIGMDFRFYLVRTDKLDATSGQRLTNPEEADSYSTTPNDKFSLLSVTLTYCFAKSGRQ